MNAFEISSAVPRTAELKHYFKRYEIKFLIDEEKASAIREAMAAHAMTPDSWGQSKICNLYYDTPDFLLARNSAGGPIYKEKLRLRSYGFAKEDGRVFVELKKKYRGIVYKRRITMCERDAIEYLSGGDFIAPERQLQIKNEVDYFLAFYKHLSPAIFLSYDREAFFSEIDPELRITFDRNIEWRRSGLSLLSDAQVGQRNRRILSDGAVLMEIKTAGAVPLWLTAFLSERGIYKTPFSKYGNAVRTCLTDGENTENARGLCLAAH